MHTPTIAPFNTDNSNFFVKKSDETNDNEDEQKNIFLKIFKTTRNKIPLTLLYCMVFWNFGICVALFGPTLLDLACQTGSSCLECISYVHQFMTILNIIGSSMTALSWLYFIQNLTSLIGCLLSGIILKHGK